MGMSADPGEWLVEVIPSSSAPKGSVSPIAWTVRHPADRTGAANHNLVLELARVGCSRKTESAHADVLTHYRRVPGDAHPAVLATANGIRPTATSTRSRCSLYRTNAETTT